MKQEDAMSARSQRLLAARDRERRQLLWRVPVAIAILFVATCLAIAAPRLARALPPELRVPIPASTAVGGAPSTPSVPPSVSVCASVAAALDSCLVDRDDAIRRQPLSHRWRLTARCNAKTARIFYSATHATPAEDMKACQDATAQFHREMGGTEFRYKSLKRQIEDHAFAQVWEVDPYGKLSCACVLEIDPFDTSDK